MILLAALVLRVGEVERSAYAARNDARSYLVLAHQVAQTGDYSTSSRPGTGSYGTRGPTALFPPAISYLVAGIDLLDGHTTALRPNG